MKMFSTKSKRLTFTEMWQLHNSYKNNQILKSLKIIYPKKEYSEVISATTFADLVLGLHQINYESFAKFIGNFK